VRVAVRACSLLAPTDGMRVLDLGAGVGKLCAIGALSSSSIWCGVEQHRSLVDTARDLSRTLGVGPRTLFVHGDMFSLDWRLFDALYLYNPFRTSPSFGDRRASECHVTEQVARVQLRLARMPRGARVVTLDGFGGEVPAGYELVYQERIAGASLVLWVRGRVSSA
jgi:predicted RNA methylase